MDLLDESGPIPSLLFGGSHQSQDIGYPFILLPALGPDDMGCVLHRRGTQRSLQMLRQGHIDSRPGARLAFH
jgi:hypothetical protein